METVRKISSDMHVHSMLLSEYYSTSCQSLSVSQRSKIDSYMIINS